MSDDLDSPHERLTWARERAGYATAAAFSAAVGVNPTTYRAYENGQNGFAKLAGRFAKKLGVSAEWLLEGGPKPMGPTPERSDEDPEDEDKVQIREWDVSYGMGGGTYLDLPVTGETHTFSRARLRHFTHAPPEKVFFARGTGDSMFPTVLDSDIVVIDTSDREVRMGDRIYAVIYGTTGYIKRIRPMADGSVNMLSDNPNVPPEKAFDGELSIVGRVVAVVRKL